MSRQALTLIVAGAGTFLALLVAAFVPVPYVALTPGPTLNTLSTANGHQLVAIEGHRVYPTSGHLNMVTVSFIGGPGTRFDIFAALQAWLSPQDAVVPEREIFPPGQTQQQVLRADERLPQGVGLQFRQGQGHRRGHRAVRRFISRALAVARHRADGRSLRDDVQRPAGSALDEFDANPCYVRQIVCCFDAVEHGGITWAGSVRFDIGGLDQFSILLDLSAEESIELR